MAAAWWLLTLFPQPLFAYTLRRANIVLHARAPLPPQAGPILEEVVRRAALSPLYDANHTHDVFLCDSSWLFNVLSLKPVGGGVTTAWERVFIRTADVARNQVISRSGKPVDGERTLTYFIAHEVAHAMTMHAHGFLRFRRLATFQREGYADYVAFAHRLDLTDGIARLQRGAPEMDPHASGLYRRYELLVAYLLDQRQLSAQQLLETPLDQVAVERALLAPLR